MKKIIYMVMFTFAYVAILTACGGSIKMSDKTSSLNDVTATLKKFETEKVKKGSTIFSPDVSITNNSSENIMEVEYLLTVFDKNGNELTKITNTYNGQDKAVAPGETVNADARGWQSKLDAPAYSVSISVTDTKTETDVPAVHLPQAGEFLYEAVNDEKINNIAGTHPVKFVIGIDQSGYLREAVFDTPEGIATAVRLFCEIKIAKESGEFVTDNYNYIYMTWKDGTTSSINLNLRNLEISVYNNMHTYELENLGLLLEYASGYLEEVSR